GPRTTLAAEPAVAAGGQAPSLRSVACPQLNGKIVERVTDVGVVVPGHLLRRRDLQLVDAEAGALGVPHPPLDLVEVACVLQRLHHALLSAERLLRFTRRAEIAVGSSQSATCRAVGCNRELCREPNRPGPY